MNAALKYSIPFVAALALGVGSAAFDPRLAEARTLSCTAAVHVYEDGTWGGGVVHTNGVKAADAWIVTHPRQQGKVYTASNRLKVLQTSFPPTSHGVVCKTYIAAGR